MVATPGPLLIRQSPADPPLWKQNLSTLSSPLRAVPPLWKQAPIRPAARRGGAPWLVPSGSEHDVRGTCLRAAPAAYPGGMYCGPGPALPDRTRLLSLLNIILSRGCIYYLYLCFFGLFASMADASCVAFSTVLGCAYMYIDIYLASVLRYQQLLLVCSLGSARGCPGSTCISPVCAGKV